MSAKTPPPGAQSGGTGRPNEGGGGGSDALHDVELLKVIIAREGQQVSAQWGIHPQMKQDLRPEDWQELTELMAKVTGLVGSRFVEILNQSDADRPGTA
ncbi:MAG: hypothetical protein ACREI3_07310 [Nitrospirales bacterium]